jgi:hypothetical protein
MNSYFEIGGHIVECVVGITSHPSSISMVSAAERPVRGRNSAKDETSSMSKTSPSFGVSAASKSSQFRTADRTLYEQWKHTAFMPIRDAREAGVNFNIPALISLGIGSNLKAVQSNYHWAMGRLMPDYDQ